MITGNRYPARGRRHDQRGATLLIALIMLVLVTLHALAAYTASTTQLRIVGNMQHRQDAQAAANLAAGQVLSSTEFITKAREVGATPLEIDVNGDDAGDYQVTVRPTCTAIMPVRAGDLDPGVPDDVQCMAGTAFGGASLCATSHWNLQAIAVPAGGAAATGATAEINQGATVRIDSGEARTFC
jgi:FlaG/FlaF family flagellin (archaellin)